MKAYSIDELITLSNKIHSFIYLTNFNNEQILIINEFLNEYQKALTNYHTDKNNEMFQTKLQILSSPLIVLQNIENTNPLKNIIINGTQPVNENIVEIKGGEDRSYTRVRKNPNAQAYIPDDSNNIPFSEKSNGFTLETFIFIFSTLLTFFLISLLFVLK